MSNVAAPEWRLLASTPDDPGQSFWTINFLNPVLHVAVNLGDKSPREFDDVYLRAYDDLGLLLGEEQFLIDDGRLTGVDLEIFSSGISRVEAGVVGSGITLGDIRYHSENPSPIPIPAAGGLLALGLGVLGARRFI